jgi:hypothetical protein
MGDNVSDAAEELGLIRKSCESLAIILVESWRLHVRAFVLGKNGGRGQGEIEIGCRVDANYRERFVRYFVCYILSIQLIRLGIIIFIFMPCSNLRQDSS